MSIITTIGAGLAVIGAIVGFAWLVNKLYENIADKWGYEVAETCMLACILVPSVLVLAWVVGDFALTVIEILS